MNNINNISDINVEKAVLSCLIIEPKIYSQFSAQLSVNLFQNVDNQIIFEIIKKLWDEGRPFDMMILVRELSKIGKVNLEKYVIDLNLSVSSTKNLEHYIQILVEIAVKRDFIDKFTKLISIANNPAEDIFLLREKAFEYFDDLFVDQFTDNNKQNRTFNQLVQTIEDSFKHIIDGQATGIPSSLNLINKVIGGWQDSDLTILAGRPAMGKTAFMVQQIVDVVCQNLKVGVFSLEMSANQIAGRIITNYTKIPNSSLLRKGLNENELETFYGLKNEMCSLNIHIDDTPGISIQNLRIKSKLMKMRYGVDIIFVDYLQLLTNPTSKIREQEISSISRGLKNIAKELEIPIIALSQLSRNVENRIDKRPMLSDLRESGSIEQDADEVIFLYRPEYYGIYEWGADYNNENTENEIEIIIGKNRQGGILNERTKVQLSTSSFKDLY